VCFEYHYDRTSTALLRCHTNLSPRKSVEVWGVPIFTESSLSFSHFHFPLLSGPLGNLMMPCSMKRLFCLEWETSSLTVHLYTKRVFVLKLKQTVVLNSSNTEVKSLPTPFFSRQAILGRQVGGKILEELSKVPSYTIQTALEDFCIRLTIKSTCSAGNRGQKSTRLMSGVAFTFV